MTMSDWEFYENQQNNPPIGYCQGFVDRRWEMSNRRKMDRLNRSRDESYHEQTCSSFHADEDMEVPVSSDSEYECEKKKSKYEFNNVIDSTDDELPFKYRHIRDGPRSVRPEIYFVISKLSSVYHMSEAQIEGSIVTIANELFGRKDFGEWKPYNKENISDNNTLPSMSNVRRTERYIEAMALNMIVQEIMADGNISFIYHGSILCVV